MVTKANMATHVDGNILEMTYMTDLWQFFPYLNLLIYGLKGRWSFSALEMKQELNTKALQSQLIW